MGETAALPIASVAMIWLWVCLGCCLISFVRGVLFYEPSSGSGTVDLSLTTAPLGPTRVDVGNPMIPSWPESGPRAIQCGLKARCESQRASLVWRTPDHNPPSPARVLSYQERGRGRPSFLTGSDRPQSCERRFTSSRHQAVPPKASKSRWP